MEEEIEFKGFLRLRETQPEVIEIIEDDDEIDSIGKSYGNNSSENFYDLTAESPSIGDDSNSGVEMHRIKPNIPRSDARKSSFVMGFDESSNCTSTCSEGVNERSEANCVAVMKCGILDKKTNIAKRKSDIPRKSNKTQGVDMKERSIIQHNQTKPLRGLKPLEESFQWHQCVITSDTSVVSDGLGLNVDDTSDSSAVPSLVLMENQSSGNERTNISKCNANLAHECTVTTPVVRHVSSIKKKRSIARHRQPRPLVGQKILEEPSHGKEKQSHQLPIIENRQNIVLNKEGDPQIHRSMLQSKIDFNCTDIFEVTESAELKQENALKSSKATTKRVAATTQRPISGSKSLSLSDNNSTAILPYVDSEALPSDVTQSRTQTCSTRLGKKRGRPRKQDASKTKSLKGISIDVASSVNGKICQDSCNDIRQRKNIKDSDEPRMAPDSAWMLHQSIGELPHTSNNVDQCPEAANHHSCRYLDQDLVWVRNGTKGIHMARLLKESPLQSQHYVRVRYTTSGKIEFLHWDNIMGKVLGMNESNSQRLLRNRESKLTPDQAQERDDERLKMERQNGKKFSNEEVLHKILQDRNTNTATVTEKRKRSKKNPENSKVSRLSKQASKRWKDVLTEHNVNEGKPTKLRRKAIRTSELTKKLDCPDQWCFADEDSPLKVAQAEGPKAAAIREQNWKSESETRKVRLQSKKVVKRAYSSKAKCKRKVIEGMSEGKNRHPKRRTYEQTTKNDSKDITTSWIKALVSHDRNRNTFYRLPGYGEQLFKCIGEMMFFAKRYNKLDHRVLYQMKPVLDPVGKSSTNTEIGNESVYIPGSYVISEITSYNVNNLKASSIN